MKQERSSTPEAVLYCSGPISIVVAELLACPPVLLKVYNGSSCFLLKCKISKLSFFCNITATIPV